MKKIITTFIIIIFICIIFIVEESNRLQSHHDANPVITIGDDNCSKDKFECYDSESKYIEELTSIGFKLKKIYYLTESSTKDNFEYTLVGEEFYLFNKILLWGWVS